MPAAAAHRPVDPVDACHQPKPDRRKVRNNVAYCEMSPPPPVNSFMEPRDYLSRGTASLGKSWPWSLQVKIQALEAQVQQLEQQLKSVELERVQEQARRPAQPPQRHRSRAACFVIMPERRNNRCTLNSFRRCG